MAEGRYRPARPDNPHTDVQAEAEARALRIIAGLLEDGTRLIPDHTVAGHVGNVLRAAATELANGRPIPIPLRRAITGLANTVRAALDPTRRDS